MSQFIKKIILHFLFPILCCVILLIYWDPFKVFKSYNDCYYKNNIPTNRENVCLQLLKKRDKNISNFIIGSSRSHAYKTEQWCNKINEPKNTAFHYDGSELGLYRATNAINYLSKRYKIKHILLITDEWFFRETNMPSKHLFIQPPTVSGENTVLYYSTFIKTALSYEFLFSNLVFKLTGKHYPFMDKYLSKNSTYPSLFNNYTGDIWYGADNEIEIDSISYYSNRIAEGLFQKRIKQKNNNSKSLILKNQIKYLNKIKDIIEINKIKIKIIISPLWSQRKMNKNDVTILKNLFGQENIHDFSGINHFTENISNFYEESHYRTHVANQIMDSIYSNIEDGRIF